VEVDLVLGPQPLAGVVVVVLVLLVSSYFQHCPQPFQSLLEQVEQLQLVQQQLTVLLGPLLLLVLFLLLMRVLVADLRAMVVVVAAGVVLATLILGVLDMI
jgi:hypothetical protein